MNIVAIAIILIGLLATAGGVFNWDRYMNNWRVRIFVQLLGRTGARVMYVLLGSALVIYGVLSLWGS